MAKYALVVGGHVNETFIDPHGRYAQSLIESLIECPIDVEAGWFFDGAEWRSSPLPPPPTAQDIKNEAQRRIIVLMGARDFNDCVIKQLNANKTAVQLNDKRINGEALTSEEEAAAVAQRRISSAIDAIRVASNVLESNPPADYTDDQYWP